MKPHDKGIIWGSTESDYRTPSDLFRPLHAEFEFELDAAASQDNALCEVWMGPGAPTKAYRDGLGAVSWAECTTNGAVWLNPPYSKKLASEARKAGADDTTIRALKIENWVQRAAREGRHCVVVAILPAAIQTEWWARYVYAHDNPRDRATEVRLIPHRVSFLSPNGRQLANAGVNHCLVIWRPHRYVGVWTPAVRYWEYRKQTQKLEEGGS